MTKERTREEKFERGSFRICDFVLELGIFEATDYPRAFPLWIHIYGIDLLIHQLSYRSRYEYRLHKEMDI